MTHLAPDQLLALAERDAADTTEPHLAACERCRADVAALRDVLSAAAAVEVPEPSPLFWDHLSRGVAAAVRREPVPSRGWWPTPAWRGLAPLGAAVLVLLAVSVWLWRPGAPRPSDASSTTNAADWTPPGVPAEAPGDDEAWEVVASLTEDWTPPGVPAEAPDDDEAWAVVASLTDGVDVETVDATGIAPTRGSVEEAASELSVPERSELIRILRVETAESGTEG